MEKSESTPRERILRAAVDLLGEGGRDAVSTRSVCAAAGVQAQTIYRQFGDMQGLLDAVARRGYEMYLTEKKATAGSGDDLDDLRRGWDLHVAFGLEHPALYKIMYADPRPGEASALTGEAQTVLLDLVRRVAKSGHLKVDVDTAAAVFHSTGFGVTFTLITARQAGHPELYRGLSEMVREMVLETLTTTAPEREVSPAETAAERATAHAVALKSLLPEACGALTHNERALLGDWLGSLSGPSHGAAAGEA